jgi:CBS domain-containing protein
MIVADEQGDLLGIVSKNDIKIRTGETVQDVMSTDLKTVSRDMPIATALSIVVKNRISCVPVVDEGRFVGLVSTTDLLIYLQCVLHSTETQNASAALASH